MISLPRFKCGVCGTEVGPFPGPWGASWAQNAADTHKCPATDGALDSEDTETNK